MKLTEAQKIVLKDLADIDYRVSYADNYKPIQRLLELEFVDRKEGKYSDTFAITPAGRAALEASNAE